MPMRLQAAYCDLYCYSIQFTRAEANTGYMEFIGTDGEFSGELFPEGTAVAQSHGASFRLSYSFGGIGTETTGRLALDIPFNDTDTNGVPDLLEVERGLPETTTSGTATPNNRPTAPVSATWQRTTGSSTGQCNLTVTGMRLFGATVTETYAFSFQVQHYRSPLYFSATGNSVVASADFRQLDALDHKLSGNFAITRKDATTLGCSGGSLMNEASLGLPFQVFDDFLLEGKAYLGVLVFADFKPATSPAENRFWIASFTDDSDGDGDGVADLADSDWQGFAEPRPPRMAITRDSADLRLALTGTPGQVTRLERAPSFDSTNWEPLSTYQIGKDPIHIDLGPANGLATFWRLVRD